MSIKNPQSLEITPEQEKSTMRRQITVSLEELILVLDQLGTEWQAGKTLNEIISDRIRLFDLYGQQGLKAKAFLISGKPRSEPLWRELNLLVCDLGRPLNEAAREFPGVFDPQFCTLLDAAQHTGNYPSLLKRQAQLLREQKQVRDQVKATLRYPMIVLVVAVVVIALAVLMIVPAFKTIYEGLLGHDEQPWMTQLVLDFSDMMVKSWPVILLVIGVGFFGYRWLRRNLPSVREGEDWFKLRIPVINRYVALVNMIEFWQVFILLREAGETLPKSLALAIEAMGNSEMRNAARIGSENFEAGVVQCMYLALARTHDIFSEGSSFYEQMRGYETSHGALDVLERYINLLKQEATRLQEEIVSYIQPVALLVIGGVVGFLVAALYLPLFVLIGKLAGHY